jgi:hypothetical protein
VTVPAADDLFRPTVVPQPVSPVELVTDDAVESRLSAEPDPDGEATGSARAAQSKAAARTASGRVKHDEKMTIYVTGDELLDIEHARLGLRRHHGLAVDRGRLVRAAVAMALAELDANGADSALVQRLNES